MSDPVERHWRACAGFGRVVAYVGDRWTAPTPCTEWDARALLEHVIGFHEVLILRPLGVRAHRPKDDPVGRWAATEAAIFTALGTSPTDDIVKLVPALTTDVLVHTWDLAHAIGADAALDDELVGRAYEQSAHMNAPSAMVGPPIDVDGDADLLTKLLARYGRRA